MINAITLTTWEILHSLAVCQLSSCGQSVQEVSILCCATQIFQKIFLFIKWLSKDKLEFEERFIINIDKTQGQWVDKKGFMHIPTINKEKCHFWIMLEMFLQLHNQISIKTNAGHSSYYSMYSAKKHFNNVILTVWNNHPKLDCPILKRGLWTVLLLH